MDCKSVDWFLYDNGLRHERVNAKARLLLDVASLIIESHHLQNDFCRENNLNQTLVILLFHFALRLILLFLLMSLFSEPNQRRF